MTFNNYKTPILPVNLSLILLNAALWYEQVSLARLIMAIILSVVLAIHPKTKRLTTGLLLVLYLFSAFR